MVFFRWEDESEPDPFGKQLQTIRDMLDGLPEIELVWVDYACMPQKKAKDVDDRSEEEKASVC